MFTLDDDIMRQLRATFKVEAAEHIQAMNRVLLALEENPEGEERNKLLEEIFREAHSLKGAAGAADFPEVESTAHKLESAFGAAKSGKIKLTRDLCDVLYEGIDAVSVIVNAALEEREHGLDLENLHVRLAAVEQGRVIPRFGSTELAEIAPPDTPLTPSGPPPRSGGHTPEGCPGDGQGVLGTASQPHPFEEPQPYPLRVPQGQPIAATNPVAEATLAARSVPGAVATPRAAPSEPKAKAPKKDERKRSAASPIIEETIRVSTNKIDSLMTQAGELLVAGLKIDQRLHDVEDIGHSIEEWNREWLKARSTHSNLLHNTEHEVIRPLVKLLDMNQERLRVLSTQVVELRRGFSSDALHLSRVTSDMGEEVMKVRMLPVSTVFDAFPRLVRDVARELGKEAELEMEGGETELDRKVLEQMKDPLMHLLRNSVDHGVERPEERLKAGKPREGHVTARAFQKGNNIVIEVTDDGGGINRAKLKQAAIKNGVISADEAETMSDDEALRLIFAPGLSTSAMITDISGRGVGMDVVRKNVEALQGLVDVESVFGQGTTITLTLPLTLATTQELLVQVNDQTYGIPISAVERIQRIGKEDISSVEGRQAMVVNNEPVSVVSLAGILELPERRKEETQEADDKTPVVILRSGRKRIAFLVNAVVGQQESVVKSLGKQLARVRNVAGATILGTGQVIMTLNPSDLMKSARIVGGEQAIALQHTAAVENKKAQQPTIMVVDDSLSTRTLEKNILESSGYKVMLAADGMEAMSFLNTNGGVNLVVSDVLMPRMGGFELTAAIRRDPKLKKIPVILVTALDSRADKERGIESGADAYIVKSNFDQANLLQTIAQLV